MTTCAWDGCTDDRYCKGFCAKHYQRWKIEQAPPCSIEGCDANQYARDWCAKHYQRWRKNGDLEAVTPYENWLRSDNAGAIAERRRQNA